MTVAIASSLVHFLWQGALIGVVAWLGFAAVRVPRARYLVGVGALALMAIAPVVTAAALRSDATPIAAPSGAGRIVVGEDVQVLSNAATSTTALSELASVPAVAGFRRALSLRLDVSARAAWWLTAAWLAGVLVLALRLSTGWLAARRLSRTGVRTQTAIRASADRVMSALGISRAVAIIESALVDVPAVVGWVRPVVLLPAAAMSGLSIAQVDALLAHELAHVRRHDYLVNLFQSAIETLLFYHPAVWLVSRRVRHERELCCDDLAIAVCGDRVAYASALADLETLRVTPAPALAATGGSLIARVRRILGHDTATSAATPGRPLAGVAILAALLLVGGNQAARLAARPDERVQLPATGVSGGMSGGTAGGVVGGVSGGSAAGVATGIDAGVSRGVAGGLTGDVSPRRSGDAAQNSRPPALSLPPKRLAGPFRVGDEHVTEERPMPPVAAPTEVDQGGPSLTAGQTIRLEVRVGQVRQADFNRDYTVQNDGTISVPYLGTITAAGQSITALQSSIQSLLTSTGALPGATVVATLETKIVRTVSVTGGVRNPGTFTWRDGLTVGDAIDMAGGAVNGADPATAEVLPAGAAKTLTDPIPAGSVVKLPPVQTATVTVMGAVRNPGKVTLPKSNLTLRDVISSAGGLMPNARSRIVVSHLDGTQYEYSTAELLSGALTTVALVEADVITVAAAPRVYVNGFVKAPGDYGWSAGMTLGKALELAGGVTPEGAAGRVKIERKLANGSYEAVALVKNPMDTPIQPDDVITIPKRRM